MSSLYASVVAVGIFAAATVTDIRSRRVPRWLTLGGILLGLAVAAMSGSEALLASLAGLVVGGVLLLPFVLKGGMGLADALLLAAGGAWLGWQPILHVALWGALAGGILALVALARGQRSLPYAPALLVGVLLALAVR
ncbi:MAG: prepilin peptidase [Anaerolineae bacterium]